MCTLVIVVHHVCSRHVRLISLGEFFWVTPWMMVLITSGMIDRRHPDDRMSHFARSILKLPSFIHIYIFACV